MTVRILVGDCRDHMAAMDAESVDAIVCDPPYGLEFMGKEWDKFATGRAAKYSKGCELTHTEFKNLGTLPQYVNRPARRCAKCGKQAWSGSPCQCDKPEWTIDNSPLRAFQAWSEAWAREAYRVAKPGAHLLAFGGSRTHHRLMVAIEDAGWEIRDCLMLFWVYGSGFPKSHSVNKAGEKAGTICTCGSSAVQYSNETLSRQTMHDLRQGLAAEESVSVNAKPNLWSGVQLGKDQPVALGADDAIAASKGADSLRGVWQGSGAQTERTEGQTGTDVLPPLQRYSTQPGVGEALGERQGQEATGQGIVGISESGVEGRGDLLPQARELQANQVHPMPNGFPNDGSERRLRDGTSPTHGEDDGVLSDSDRDSSSHRPRPPEQRPGEPRTVARQPQSQTGGAWPLCGRCGLPVLPPGLGSALKPSYEPIVVARKPLAGTLLDNVLTYGTGAINVDGCRIEITDDVRFDAKQRRNNIGGGGYEPGVSGKTIDTDISTYKESGRWPANVLLDEEAAALLDQMSGERRASLSNGPIGRRPGSSKFDIGHDNGDPWPNGPTYGDTGGASRFFYTAKASRAERNRGLDGMPERDSMKWAGGSDAMRGIAGTYPDGSPRPEQHARNHHPTVKPLDLMQWLVRLVTPPGGVVLDPFMGSGSTMVAADREGFDGIGIEIDPEYVEIAKRRVYGDAPMFAEVAD